MKVKISSEIREKYPELRIGIVLAEGVINEDYKNGLDEYCADIFKKFSNKYDAPKDLALNKNIDAWRNIYHSFGVNPKKKTPTAEALLTRAIKNYFVPHISPAVDSYLIAETLHCLPIGGYDIEKVVGNIVLKISDGNEDFQGIGANEVEKTSPGEVVYADDERILTRRWNYKDCELAKIDKHTKRLALFVEGPLNIIEDREIVNTVEAIALNLTKFCDATTKTIFMDRDVNEIDLT